MRTIAKLLLASLVLPSCDYVEQERQAAADSARAATILEIQSVLDEAVRSSDRAARRANRILSPLPVMSPAEEGALRRYRNAAHVRRAREAGVRVAGEPALDSLLAEGRLVALPDSTQHWIVRPGTAPTYVVPQVIGMLELLGTRFQDRLSELGLPPYRIEVTSALRTSERQAELRATNRNAAVGVSSHEFGTTLDVSYAAFAPPATRPAGPFASVPESLAPHMGRIVDLAFESVSARKSRELTRIFSQVLREAQAEGLVLVIYERQQTVYHLTVGAGLETGVLADGPQEAGR